jgi:hypothetical protein
MLRPLLSALDNPLQVVTGIAHRGNPIGKKNRAFPSHKMHMGINKTRKDGRLRLMLYGHVRRHLIQRHYVGNYTVLNQYGMVL